MGFPLQPLGRNEKERGALTTGGLAGTRSLNPRGLRISGPELQPYNFTTAKRPRRKHCNQVVPPWVICERRVPIGRFRWCFAFVLRVCLWEARTPYRNHGPLIKRPFRTILLGCDPSTVSPFFRDFRCLGFLYRFSGVDRLCDFDLLYHKLSQRRPPIFNRRASCAYAIYGIL